MRLRSIRGGSSTHGHSADAATPSARQYKRRRTGGPATRQEKGWGRTGHTGNRTDGGHGLQHAGMLGGPRSRPGTRVTDLTGDMGHDGDPVVSRPSTPVTLRRRGEPCSGLTASAERTGRVLSPRPPKRIRRAGRALSGLQTRRFVHLERESWPTWSRSPLLSRLRFGSTPLKPQQVS
jgi:hypothetical protein